MTSNKNAKGTASLQLTRFKDIKSELVGAVGTPKREAYEAELSAEIVAEKIKALRKAKKMTQQELGELLGVGKSQVSRLESTTSNATIETIQKVFNALGAKIQFNISLGD